MKCISCLFGFGIIVLASALMSGCSDGPDRNQPTDDSDASARAETNAESESAAGLGDAVMDFLAGEGQSLLPEREGGRYFTPIRPATAERIARLKLPEGFAVEVWARDLGSIRMMALGPDGTVYVTRPSTGEVLALRDTDGDGRAEPPKTAVQLDRVHGIHIHEGRKMYLATVGEAFVCNFEDGRVGEPRRIVTGMPTAPGHHNRTLAVGPDGRLFITVGSTCNCCWEENPENATMLISGADGANRRVFARGLRNTIGFGWHPQTGQLWGMDHGIDWLGPNTPPEELNHIEEGHHYGWPFVYGDRQTIGIERHEAVGSLKDFAEKTTPPVLGYQAHSSPIAMVFYTGEQFPAEYRSDAFVAFHGSWNREQPVGYLVARIRFRDGRPVAFEDFLTGFLVDDVARPYAFGRPAGLLVAEDGSLLVCDDTNGVIYRVIHVE